MSISARLQINSYKCLCGYYRGEESFLQCPEDCPSYLRRKREAMAIAQLKSLQSLADAICRQAEEGHEEEKPRITIEVSGDMVQNVYTTLEIDVEVDVLDFDGNGTLSDKEREELQEHLRRVVAEHRQIY